MIESSDLSKLAAFRVAHAQDETAATGCTVIVAPEGAVCGVDVRGGAPATRETDLLRPENMVEQVHAVMLSGGSAFGLEAASGVMDELAARGIGFQLGEARVPIVVGASLFDLLVGENAHPDKAMGALGAQRAFMGGELQEGNVGAGCGASVGKLLGPDRAMKTGFGYSCLKSGELVCAALVALNACGNVCDESGRWIAGCRDDEGNVLDPVTAFDAMTKALGESHGEKPCQNTTIGAVLTNARLTKAQATKVSTMVHDAYARRIKPVHTLNDGDTIFTLASGDANALPDVVGFLATEAMQHALVRAATCAQPSCGLPAANA